MEETKLITGKTTSGFEFEVDSEALDDYELVEMIAELDDGKTQNLPKIYEKLLGTDQKKALMEFLRKENGRVSFIEMTNAFFEIMQSIKEGKKS